jgi:hypothetical protein
MEVEDLIFATTSGGSGSILLSSEDMTEVGQNSTDVFMRNKLSSHDYSIVWPLANLHK